MFSSFPNFRDRHFILYAKLCQKEINVYIHDIFSCYYVVYSDKYARHIINYIVQVDILCKVKKLFKIFY